MTADEIIAAVIVIGCFFAVLGGFVYYTDKAIRAEVRAYRRWRGRSRWGSPS